MILSINFAPFALNEKFVRHNVIIFTECDHSKDIHMKSSLVLINRSAWYQVSITSTYLAYCDWRIDCHQQKCKRAHDVSVGSRM